jgi:predicted transcriptional regulator
MNHKFCDLWDKKESVKAMGISARLLIVVQKDDKTKEIIRLLDEGDVPHLQVISTFRFGGLSDDCLHRISSARTASRVVPLYQYLVHGEAASSQGRGCSPPSH